MNNNEPPNGTPKVNPPMEGAPPGVPNSKPPSVSSEELDKMIEAGLKANRADYESDEVDLSGAGPQPLDDSAFGGDD